MHQAGVHPFMRIKWIGLVSLLFVSGCSGCVHDYSEGDRHGTIVKVSRKGMFTKSWEGQMNLGGTMRSGDTVVPSTWEFSILDETLVPRAQAAAASGERVTVHYRQWWAGPATQDTPYDAISIVPMKPETKP